MEVVGQGGRATLEKEPGCSGCAAAIPTLFHMLKLLYKREMSFCLGATVILAFVTAAKRYPN